MDVGEFLLWLERARVEERCAAARSVARAVTDPDLDAEERCAADAALMLLLDDPSPKVRRVLSDVLSLSARAPGHALHALAVDQHDVAAPVVARCAVSDDTLVAALDNGHPDIAALIADRARVSGRVALAIAGKADLRACLALVTNPGAACGEAVFTLIIDRLSADNAELRGALALDPRLSLALRQRLVDATAGALKASRLVQRLLGARRADAVCAEAAADAPLILTESAEPAQLAPYAASLGSNGRLTAGLLIRALVHGRIDFAASAVCELSGRDEARVRAVFVRGGATAVSALLRDAGLKGAMAGLGAEAVVLWRDVALGRKALSRQDIAWSLAVAASADPARGGNDDLAALMRRIYMDIARDVARENARGMVQEARQVERLEAAAAEALEDGFFAMFSALDGEIEPPLALAEAGMPALDIAVQPGARAIHAVVEAEARPGTRDDDWIDVEAFLDDAMIAAFERGPVIAAGAAPDVRAA